MRHDPAIVFPINFVLYEWLYPEQEPSEEGILLETPVKGRDGRDELQGSGKDRTTCFPGQERG